MNYIYLCGQLASNRSDTNRGHSARRFFSIAFLCRQPLTGVKLTEKQYDPHKSRMKLNLFSIATAMLAVMTGVGIPAGAQEDNRDEYRPGGSEAYYLRLSGSEHHSADFHVNFRWDNAVI